MWSLLGAVIAGVAGMGWLALAMDVHWQQVRGQASSRGTALRLRGLGVLGLAVSLALCLRTDHASMAALVWVMVVTASALAVTLALAWRPRWLRALAWVA
ncbi:MAG: DUF3325 domain-containing protein [Burkholderiaceae bacterium]